MPGGRRQTPGRNHPHPEDGLPSLTTIDRLRRPIGTGLGEATFKGAESSLQETMAIGELATAD